MTDVCSLIVKTPQLIEPNRYTVVRFPFGTFESHDPCNMHSASRPQPLGPVTDWQTDDRSGLIVPAREGWAVLSAMVQWESDSGPTEYRDQFVRDPLGYTLDPVNTTATEHRPPSPGMQCFAKTWQMFVNPDTPLALRVHHNGPVPVAVTLAEFKLAIL